MTKIKWHTLLQMHVYHAVLAKENVQLEQSLQAMENTTSTLLLV